MFSITVSKEASLEERDREIERMRTEIKTLQQGIDNNMEYT